MVQFSRLAVIPVFLFLFLFTTVQASAEYTTNKEAFMLQYPDLTRQDFQESPVAPGTIIGCSTFLNSSTDDPCVSPGDILPEISFSVAGNMAPPLGSLAMAGRFANGSNNPNNSLLPEFSTDRFRINFQSGTVNVAGIQVGCLSQGNCSQTVSIQAFGPGDQGVGSFELQVTDSFDSFLGISRPGGINAIFINGGGNDFVAGVDAVYFGKFSNVPTMSEWGMIATVVGLGFIGFIVIRRRKKAFN